MSTDISTSEASVTEEQEWRRLDPRMLLVHPVRELGRAVPILLALVFASSGSGNGALWGLAGGAILIVLSISRWFTTRYRIGSDQVQIREGLLRRRTLSARLDRVRSVDVTSHVLHRALGLARVEIGTGISDPRGRSGLRLDGLPASAAAQLRVELLHRSSTAEGTAQGGPEPPAVPGAQGGTRADLAQPGRPVELEHRDHEVEITRLDPSWIRFAPFTLSGVFTGLAVLGFGWRLVSEGHVDLERLSPVHAAAQQVSQAALWLAVVEVAVAMAVFVALASTAGYVLAYWNFRLTRHAGGTFQVTRGLITTRATSIEVTRLRGVAISEPLPLRMVSGARTMAIATGLVTGRGASANIRGGAVLLPDAPLSEARRVAGEVLGPDAPVGAAVTGHGQAARRRRFTRALGGAVVLAVVVSVGWWIGGADAWAWPAMLLLPVLAVPLAADRARNLGHLVRDGFLVTQSGSLTRRRAILDTDAIIGWNVQQSFFQRRAGVASLVATTAAGRQSYRLLDLPAVEVGGVAEACLPGLLAAFAADPTPRPGESRPGRADAGEV